MVSLLVSVCFDTAQALVSLLVSVRCDTAQADGVHAAVRSLICFDVYMLCFCLSGVILCL